MTTFILIHGAYQGGWIWNMVADRLVRAGHRVMTPTLEGCAERAHQLRAGITTETHAEELAQLLHFHDFRDVVLAATSSGGMVMARLAELTRERVARLVFVDALALLDGEKIRDLVTRPATRNTDLALGPSREDAEQRLLQDLEPGLRSWTAQRFTLHPIGGIHGAGETGRLLAAVLAGIGALLFARRQPWRSAYPAHG